MVSSKDPQSTVRTLGVLWEITVAVLLREGDEEQLVHAAVSMKDCPLCIIELAQQLYPEQLLEIDDNGCIPLILATNNGLEDVMNVMLRANPSAAPIPNAQGRLPLLLAAASHYSGEPTIKSLFDAGPRVVSSQDPTTLLFPFALAAVDETREETNSAFDHL
jgi:ankyrin repeat protein